MKKMNRNKEQRGAAFGGAPNGAAAPLGLCSLFLVIYLLYYEHFWIFLIFHIFFKICSIYFPLCVS